MQGNCAGGQWKIVNWDEVPSNINVPKPENGKSFLMVERFNTHSGKTLF